MSLIRRYALPLSLFAALMLMIAAPYLIPENPDSAIFRSGTLGAMLIAASAFPLCQAFSRANRRTLVSGLVFGLLFATALSLGSELFTYNGLLRGTGSLIRRLGKKHTMILSTHILQEVQSVCDRIIVINKGQLIADGTADSLTYKTAGNRKLVARIAGGKAEVKKAIRALDGVLFADEMGQKEPGTCDFLIESQPSVDIRKPFFRMLAERGWVLMGLKSMDMSLEDVFVNLIANEGGVEEE